MDPKAGQILEKIAADGLGKCVAKLSRISAGEWSLVSSRVSLRSMQAAVKEHSAGDPGSSAGVYFEVKGSLPFVSMIVFRPGDIEILSRGFLGFSFSKLPHLNEAQELLLSELGNIIFNSLVSALSGALGRSFIPSVPKCVQGEVPFLLEALWAALGRQGDSSLVTVILDLRCGKDVTRCEVIALMPEQMEAALAAAEAGR